MQLIIRADATPSMGTGHVMRCMALALAAKEQGLDVTMLSHAGVEWVRKRLHAESVDLWPLATASPVKESPGKLLEDLACVTHSNEPHSCWVVLDGYHFGLDCQKAVRDSGYRLMVIDDYAHLPEYSCDILLNQNIGADLFVYGGDIAHTKLGLRYALMRPEFAAARQKSKLRIFSKKARNILLTLGGGDLSCHLDKFSSCFALPGMESCCLRVVAGGIPQDRIFAALHDCRARIEIIPCVGDMPSLLLDTDLCITAGGSTCWELCCLGVPFLPVALADNQRNIVESLEFKKVTSRFSESTFHAWLHDPSCRQAASFAGARLVDGNGANSVLAYIMR